jgi:hypothetical protein
MGRRSGLPVPRCKCLPQIVPAKVFAPRATERSSPGLCVHVGDRVAPERENVGAFRDRRIATASPSRGLV